MLASTPLQGTPLSRRTTFLILALLLDIASTTFAQAPAATSSPQSLPFGELRWRLIGPFRGGRSLTAQGIPGQPATYYFGSVGGGVWKSTDAGMTWEPIF